MRIPHTYEQKRRIISISKCQTSKENFRPIYIHSSVKVDHMLINQERIDITLNIESCNAFEGVNSDHRIKILL